MTSFLFIGFLIGIRHALEADHLAAVSSITSGTTSLQQGMRMGVMWGLGHTITLLAFGAVMIWMDMTVPDSLASSLEFVVGIMLVALGVDVIRRVIRDRIHFHTHRHSQQKTAHLHAHSHAGETNHNQSRHEHEHQSRYPIRALFIGLMHGLAGSAALILLTLDSADSTLVAILYIALFGLGSVVGMACLSLIIAIPFKFTSRYMTWAHNGLQGAIGVFTVAIGIKLMLSNI